LLTMINREARSFSALLNSMTIFSNSGLGR
jgi:hypothetical protein